MITKHGAKLANKVYENKVVYPPFLLINLKDYHNGLIWFFGCVALQLLRFIKMILKKTHLIYLKSWQKKSPGITRCTKCTNPKRGKAVKRLFYKSEQGFAWSAGLFVWAYQELFNKPK